MSERHETLGQRLQRLRAAAGMTQAKLAGAAGVPISSLRNWETDQREPSWRALVAVSDVLGVSANDFGDVVEVKEGKRPRRQAGPTVKPGGLIQTN